jgi:vitamin B12 transporter
LSQIATASIERIEVVRGNLSALYGANATGGVIQVFTRSGAPGFDADGRVGAGSRNTAWTSASVAGGSRLLNARLTLAAERTSGISAAMAGPASTANPDADGNRRADASLSLASQWAEGQSLALRLRSLVGRTAYDSVDSFSSPTDVHQARIVQQGASLTGSHRLGEIWTLSWRADHSAETRHDSVTSINGDYAFGNALHQRGLMAQFDVRPSAGVTLQAAAEQQIQATDNPTYLRNSRRTETLRFGAAWDVGAWSLQANLRDDKTGDFGAARTYLLGAGRDLGGGWRWLGSLATSFTPPTLDFLFYDCSPYSVCSNSGLRPERARNVETGVQWQSATMLLKATVFASRYRDKIANDVNFIPQNIGSARNQGVEIAAQGRWGAWRLRGEATFQDPLDETKHSRLIRRAREQATLRTDYDAADWSAGATLRHVGDRIDGAQRLAAYQVVDLSANWRVSARWQIQARVDNLFDQAWQPAAGYNGTPRGLYAGLVWQSGR